MFFCSYGGQVAMPFANIKERVQVKPALFLVYARLFWNALRAGCTMLSLTNTSFKLLTCQAAFPWWNGMGWDGMKKVWSTLCHWKDLLNSCSRRSRLACKKCLSLLWRCTDFRSASEIVLMLLHMHALDVYTVTPSRSYRDGGSIWPSCSMFGTQGGTWKRSGWIRSPCFAHSMFFHKHLHEYGSAAHERMNQPPHLT